MVQSEKCSNADLFACCRDGLAELHTGGACDNKTIKQKLRFLYHTDANEFSMFSALFHGVVKTCTVFVARYHWRNHVEILERKSKIKFDVKIRQQNR